MKNIIRLLSLSVALLFTVACGSGAEKKSAPASSDNGGTQSMSLTGWESGKGGNPIPPNWQPMFRWVANGEVDSMYRIFTDGMHFMIAEQGAATPQQARDMLRGFYRDNKPISFSYKHNGQSQSGLAQYAIGELATDKTNYRVTMVLQNGFIISLEYELL